MNTHTPGPWSVASRENYLSIMSGDTRVASPAMHFMGQSAEANARLIAAAPDLLAALVGLDNAGALACPHIQKRTPTKQGIPCGVCLKCKATAAIAKARGECAASADQDRRSA